MWKKILLIAFGCALAIVVGEAVARNILTVEKFIADPTLKWRGNPKFGHDANGFRNPNIPETAEIVAIGDSQTYGANAQMEESWPYLLGAYQMAFGGYGPAEYSILFDRALKLNPKTVIVGFFSGNDLRDTVDDVYGDERWKEIRAEHFTPNWGATYAADPDANLILQYGAGKTSFRLVFVKLRNWIYGNSKLYIFLGKSTRVLREKLGFTDTIQERDQKAFAWTKDHPEAGIAFERGSVSTILAPALRVNTIDLDNPNTAEGWRLTKDLFTSMRDRADGKTRLVFVYIPTKEFVYGVLEKESRLRDAFLQFCGTIKVRCIDATPGLVDALQHDVAIVSLGADGHYNAGGYKAIADAIYHELHQ